MQTAQRSGDLVNEWKKVENWLYSHDFFDASKNLREIKRARKPADLLAEYEIYDVLKSRSQFS